MSELKPYIGPHPIDHTLTEYYLKSKADKVIAELKSDIADLRDDKKLTDAILDERNAEITELKADYEEACDRLQTANLIKDEQLAATRHQKYKRCLAMAYVEWLKQLTLCNYPESILYRRAARRERKWKEMAEKFKEAK